MESGTKTMRYTQRETGTLGCGCISVIAALALNLFILYWLIMGAVAIVNATNDDCTLKPFLIPHVERCEK